MHIAVEIEAAKEPVLAPEYLIEAREVLVEVLLDGRGISDRATRRGRGNRQ